MTLPILPQQTNWFFDCGICACFMADDVVEMTVALLSRCTSPAGQAMQAPYINCFAAYTCMGLARSAPKSVCYRNPDFFI